MVSPDRYKAVVELGKRLVAQLKLGDDLLAQWMAHDVAARMSAVEHAGTPEALRSAQERCANSILSLWEHRNELPSHLRPFKDLEPLVRILASLDVDKPDENRYFRPIMREAALDDVDDPKAKEWLELAVGLDYSARVLIQHALRTAGAAAAFKASPWVNAAIEAGTDPVLERHAVAFVLPASPNDEDAKTVQQSLLREKVEKLEAFATFAAGMAAELRTQLDSDEGLKPQDTQDRKRTRAKRKKLP
jgi:hypothetical protein